MPLITLGVSVILSCLPQDLLDLEQSRCQGIQLGIQSREFGLRMAVRCEESLERRDPRDGLSGEPRDGQRQTRSFHLFVLTEIANQFDRVCRACWEVCRYI